MASGSTTVGALPYPVSTDAPNVHTDVQALAQALANRLAAPTARAASATMAYGELAVSTASPITLTLPSATANARVGVFAKVTSATSPVTVSGSLIYGAGLSGASSLVLGVVGSFVVLQSDGTNWFVVAGQQETGWIQLSLGGTGGSNTTEKAWARLRGDQVQMKGSYNSGGAANVILPSNMRPPANISQIAISNSGGFDFAQVTASTGAVFSASAGSPALNNVAFSIS